MKRYAMLLVMLVLVCLAEQIVLAGTLVDNGDSTISDQVTHLMWQKQNDGTTQTWTSAISYCESLTLAGHADWRLPTIKELKSIADMTKINPAINTTYFPGTGTESSSYYWSSTTYADSPSFAWYVVFYYGYSDYGNKTYTYYVRCVR